MGRKKNLSLSRDEKMGEVTREKNFFLTEKKKGEPIEEPKKRKRFFSFVDGFFLSRLEISDVLFPLQYGGTPASFFLESVLFRLY